MSTKYKIIKTSSGKRIKVDVDDFEKLNQVSWQVTPKGYAVSEIKTKPVIMHRLVMGIHDPKIQVDHIKGNKLDNRKSQLRLCTNQQNQFNRVKHKRNTSGYRGVYWKRETQKWISITIVNKKCHWFGSFQSKKDALIAWNIGVKKIHGKFARLQKWRGDL
jgi:hypothetical protein